jgi:hypothetical protein
VSEASAASCVLDGLPQPPESEVVVRFYRFLVSSGETIGLLSAQSSVRMIRNKLPNKAQAFGLLEGPLGGVQTCEND